VTEGWRKLHNEEPILIRMIKSRRRRWTGHVAQMGEREIEVIGGKARGKKATRKNKT
jgi:hypothetical protein